MKRLIWTSVVCAAVTLVVPHVVSGTPKDAAAQPARLVRLGLRDGSSTIVRLDGVGCNESICSRVAVNSRAVGNPIVNHTRFDEIVAIQEIDDDTVLFVFNDGTKRRVSVVLDNRVLYVISPSGRTQKISLRQVQSIDFNATDSK
jgi:hypothetical protein